jgi:hypothetical protein
LTAYFCNNEVAAIYELLAAAEPLVPIVLKNIASYALSP